MVTKFDRDDSAREQRDALDDALDAALRTITDVEPGARTSSARVHARLAESGRVGSERARSSASWWVWSTATIVVALVGAFLMASWRSSLPVPAAGPMAQRDRELPAQRIDPELNEGGKPPLAARPQGNSGVELPRVRSTRMREPVSSVAVAPTSVAAEAPDRLEALIRDLQSLPPEVWTRVDAAGPPGPLPPLSASQLAIEPITIDALPSEAASPFEPSGGFR